MQKNKKPKYNLTSSPIYKLANPKKLAELLSWNLKDLENLANRNDNYECWKEGERDIQHPKQQLKLIHKRIMKLLSRIETPDYLHSAVQGKSYITNATAHIGTTLQYKRDIKKFYPSTKFWHIYQFLHDDMKCPKDVATLLCKLITFKPKNGEAHLPTGSPASPILAYFSHMRMFDKIHSLASSCGVNMTCYVDDITFSGEKMPKSLISACMKAISNRQLEYHTKREKLKFYGHSRVAIITGWAVSKSGILLPFKRHEKIKTAHDNFFATDAITQKANVNSLFGMVSEASQIDTRFNLPKQHIFERKRYLEKIPR
jgi:hypothetical protein